MRQILVAREETPLVFSKRTQQTGEFDGTKSNSDLSFISSLEPKKR